MNSTPNTSSPIQVLVESQLVPLEASVKFCYNAQTYGAKVGWIAQEQQAAFVHTYEIDERGTPKALPMDHPNYLSSLSEESVDLQFAHVISGKDPSAWMKNVVKLYTGDRYVFCCKESFIS